MMKFRTLFLFLVLMLMGQSMAQIKDSGEWIIQRREHNLLDRLETSLGFPNTEMGAGNAVVTLNIEGPNVTVMVIGPIKGDAKSYAQALDDWRTKAGFKGEVLYSQEDDCAAASLSVKEGGFGKMEAKVDVPVADLVAMVGKVEPTTKIAMLAPAWTNLDYTEKPSFTAKNGNRIWDITNSTSLQRITSTLTIPGWIVPALIAWVFLPIVGLIVCFGVGITAAKDTRRPIEQRRKIYATMVVKGTYVVLGLHALLVIATLPTRALDPVSQLWFGFRFSQIGLIVVPIFGLGPMLLLPWLNKTETRLLGPTTEEAATKEDFSKYQAAPPIATEVQPKKKTFPYSLIFLVVGFAVMLWPLPKTSPLVPFQRFGLLVAFIPTFASLFTPRKKLKEMVEPDVPNKEQYRERVNQRAKPLAEQLGVPVLPIKIGPLLQGPYGAAISRQALYVTPAMADRFSDRELDFILAHEFAHQKKGHVRTKVTLVIVPAVCIWLLFTALIFGKSLSITLSPSFIFSPFLVLLVVTPLYGLFLSRLSQRHEFEADELAVRTTRDKDAATSALKKITEQNSLPGMDEVVFNRTHPKVKERIARIQAIAIA